MSLLNFWLPPQCCILKLQFAMPPGGFRKLMFLSGLLSLLIAGAGLFGCGRSIEDPAPPTKWTTSFWFWEGSSASVADAIGPVDAVYCQVGSVVKQRMIWLGRGPWTVSGNLPERLPQAHEYWLVFRSVSPGVPALQAIQELRPVVYYLQQEGRRRGLNVAGIQLDVDSPTRALPQYAAFLREVRKGLPPGVQISITALLDWFRAGTAVDEVIKEVDEFVPQFYDVQGRGNSAGGGAIPSPVVAAQWGPVFNRHRKRFRIGISTFGRARLTRSADSPRFRSGAVEMFTDLKPLDIAIDSTFNLQTSTTDAKELVLRYRATRETRIGYTDCGPGDTVEFVIPTPDAIRPAVEQAKLIHGYCAGVVFFRWPAFNETLTVQPSQVLAAAGVVTQPSERPAGLRVVDGNCAAVECVDLYLVNASPLSSKSIRYRIDSSTELEYFLPSERMPVRLSGPSRIELLLPPYGGSIRMHLGRAVTAKRAEFTMKEER